MKKPLLSQHAADIGELSAFFGRLSIAKQEQTAKHLESFARQWESFRPGFAAALAAARASERVSASGYNIFRVLRVEHDEENTHSRFLADLLNPRGTHGQGHLFLQTFVDHCHEKQGWHPLAREAFSMPWYIETEKGTQQGRIDVVLACPQARYLIAIENKVFATEQARQIKRYYMWLESQSNAYSYRQLLFLTPDGREPLTAAGCHCLPLSYREDISRILRETMKGVVAPHLQAIIGQYLEIVETLISQGEVINEA